MRHRCLAVLTTTMLILPLLLLPIRGVHAAMDVAKQVLIGADYSDRDLRGATFNLSNLREANLSGSDLRGASLLEPNCRMPISMALTCAKPPLIQRS